MASITANFSTVSQGPAMLVQSGDAISYSVTGTFVATVQLEYSTTAGQTWTVLQRFTAPASGVRTPLDLPDRGSALVRFNCVARTSGIAVTRATNQGAPGETYEGADGVAQAAGVPSSQVVGALQKIIAQGGATSLALLGDSNTGHNTSPENAVNTYPLARSEYFNAFQNYGWLTWAIGLQGLLIPKIYNFGEPGDATGFVSASSPGTLYRVKDVIAVNPDVCILCSGTNDPGTFTTAQSIANNQATVDALIAAGIFVIWLGLSPRSDGATSAAVVNQLLDINRAMAEYMADRPLNGVAVDVFSALADTTTALSPWKTGYSNNDGLHYGIDGAYVAGNILGLELKKYFPTAVLPRSNGEVKGVSSSISSQLVSNPLLLGPGGTNNGGATASVVPANWTVWGTTGMAGQLTLNMVTATNGVGSAAQLVCTPTGAGVAHFYADDVKSRAVVGHRLYAVAYIRVSGVTTGYKGTLLQWQTNGSMSSSWNADNSVVVGTFPDGYIVRAVTPVLVYDGAGSNLRLWVTTKFTAAGAATVQLETLGIIDMDA